MLPERAAARRLREPMSGISHDVDSLRGAVGSDCDPHRDDGLVHVVLVRFGREGTIPFGASGAASAAGLDPSRYGGHSLRSGFITTAAEKGRPLEAIMRQDGAQTESVARGYIQHATVFVKNPAKGLV
jgi:hypothetical protein